MATLGFCRILSLTFGLFTLLTVSGPIVAAARPNVVLILTDDQGYGDIAAHGNSVIKTPHLDKLHGESVRLTNFHVDPTCSPTRSALNTGRYSTRTGVWHTIAGRSLMSPRELTLAEIFAANGYRTAMFGKWHLGDNYPLRAHDQGFHESLYNGGGGVTQTPDYWGNDYFDDTYFRNGAPEKFEGYCTDIWFREALKFIEQNKETEQPFFCYLATNAPHGPYLVAEEEKQPYLDAGVPEPMASFYGMITNIDRNVGKLAEKLNEWKLAENTILIFMTDNGTAAGIARQRARIKDNPWKGFNAGMRGQKGSEYDGGHRVPFFIRWPAKFKGGRDVSQLAAHVDVLPTLVDLCQLNQPKGPPLDGTSLVPLITGTWTEWPNRKLFVHSQRIEYPEKWRKCAVMTQRWRLVNGKELYDMQEDPGQTSDVAAGHPDVVTELRQAYEGWWKSLSPAFDDYVPIVVGSDQEPLTRLTCHDWHADVVPWNQQAVSRDPAANGYWVVEVPTSGKLEFTLRLRPAEVDHPLGANHAKVKLSDVEAAAAVPAGASQVTLTVDAPAGRHRLQTWLISPDGTERGAFFTYVRAVQ